MSSIEDIWNKAGVPVDLPGVNETAVHYQKRSIQLTDRIRQTAQREQTLYIWLAGFGFLALLGFQQYAYAAILLVFTALISWKYYAEMRMFDRIKPESGTLPYLLQVKGLLQYFMKIYYRAILFLIPLVFVGTFLFATYQEGHSLSSTFTNPVFYSVMLIGSIISIVLSWLWIKLWAYTLYGKKMKELEGLIAELKGEVED